MISRSGVRIKSENKAVLTLQISMEISSNTRSVWQQAGRAGASLVG